MLLDILWVSLWGGIVALDTTAALQIMISRPIVSCAVVGAILGDFALGFQVGIFLELLWINELPVGSTKFTEGNVGSAAAASIAIFSMAATQRPIPSTVFALIVALFVGRMGSRLVEIMRTRNGKRYDKLLESEDFTIKDVTKAHISGLTLAFTLGSLLLLVPTVLFGLLIVPQIIALIPAHVDKFIQPISYAILGVGCGILLYMFTVNNKYWWASAFGLVGGMLLAFL